MIKTQRLEQLGLSADDAASVAQRVNDCLWKHPPGECWQHVSDSVLRPEHPFDVHRYVHETVFADWDETRGPRPAWVPTRAHIEGSNLHPLMKQIGHDDYASFHRWSVDHHEAFWDSAIGKLDIRFRRPPQKIVDLAQGVQKPDWLPAARLNVVESCFQADPDAPAIVCGLSSGALTSQTYEELRRLTNRVSNGLRQCGFAPGDAIAVDMPMTPESVVIYLGIIQAGCVVVSIADSFAAPQIRTRLAIADTRGIFTTDHMVRGGKRLPMYKKVVEADAPRAIVLPGPEGMTVERRPGDATWEDFLGNSDDFDPHIAAPGDDINVLFSSGTTAEPKAIPWHHTTAIKAAVDGHFHQDIQAANVVAWPTNLGWMMGPWLIFASLINRATIALFQDAPTGRSFGSFVQDAKVTMLGVVPSIVRLWRQSRCMEGLDWHAIRAFSSTGECSNADDMLYLMHLAGYRPVVEYCGGTEIGGGYITGTLIQPSAPSTFSTPALGIDVQILDADGVAADVGELFLVGPSMGLSTRLLNRDHAEVYFDSTPACSDGRVLRRHGDHFQRLAGGYYRAQGRVDDTMNLGGIKASSAQIERALEGIDGVTETAAVACPPPEGGPDRLVIYAVCDAGAPNDSGTLIGSMQKAISAHLNPLFKVHDVVVVDALPRTASQKVMRRHLRAQYEGGDDRK